MTQLNFTLKQLDDIHRCGLALMTPADTARFLGLKAEERELFLYSIKEESDLDFVMAWWQGRTETKLTLHESIVKLAEKGSPAAGPIAESYLREQTL